MTPFWFGVVVYLLVGAWWGIRVARTHQGRYLSVTGGILGCLLWPVVLAMSLRVAYRLIKADRQRLP